MISIKLQTITCNIRYMGVAWVFSCKFAVYFKASFPKNPQGSSEKMPWNIQGVFTGQFSSECNSAWCKISKSTLDIYKELPGSKAKKTFFKYQNCWQNTNIEKIFLKTYLKLVKLGWSSLPKIISTNKRMCMCKFE